MSIQTSIDGFRLQAERSGKYAGQVGPYWTADGKEWREVWLESTPPRAAKLGVLRSDFKEPLWSVARYDEYVQLNKEKKPNSMWVKMGANQLAKCCEALALRRAFPNELSGQYTPEEMAQASNIEVVTDPQSTQDNHLPPPPPDADKVSPQQRKALWKAICKAIPDRPAAEKWITAIVTKRGFHSSEELTVAALKNVYEDLIEYQHSREVQQFSSDDDPEFANDGNDDANIDIPDEKGAE
jgi:hypothetical protein